MYTDFRQSLLGLELKNLRILNVAAALLISVLGFVFQIAYHDGDILVTGLAISIILTSNYFFSFYSGFYKKHFLNISFRGAVRALLRNFSFECSNDGIEHSAYEATRLFVHGRPPVGEQ